MNPVSLLASGVTFKTKSRLPGLPVPQEQAAAGAMHPSLTCSSGANGDPGPAIPGSDKIARWPVPRGPGTVAVVL